MLLDNLCHLHPGAMLFPNVVAVHDVQDLISDGLSIAAPAYTSQHAPYPLLCGATCPSMCLHHMLTPVSHGWWQINPYPLLCIHLSYHVPASRANTSQSWQQIDT
jgi:hypothetical protein